MTKKEALFEINETQDFYVSKLRDIVLGIDNRFENLKEIDFTSPTGTGKTVMVAKLMNQLPSFFFVITSLSKGQLRQQVENKIKLLSTQNNFIVFGSNEYTKNTILQEADIIRSIPDDKKVIWIRDEGHIATNRWQEVLRERSSHIINFSATNKSNNGIQCNFSHTMMLRTVSQSSGTPEEALDQLLEVKNLHKNISGYNPCALFRVIHDENLDRVIEECRKRNLSYINITDENYDMSDICEDDNQYDVIINKFKITEGIDLKRCHVIYMDSKPSNEATVVQVIGRARRNALFWRNDIDIMAKENSELLEDTRKCFVFYNIPETEVAQNDLGELTYSLCDTISVEALKPNIKITVTNGQLPNGLYVLELLGRNGNFNISYDERLGANVVSNPDFYKEEVVEFNPFVVDLSKEDYNIKRIYLKPNFEEFFVKNVRRSNRERDRYKYYFYYVKLYCSRHETNIDINYWEEYLNMNNKKVLVKDEKWGEFFYDPERYDLFKKEIEGHFITNFSDKDIAEAKEYARIHRDPEYVEKKDIFVNNNWDEMTFLSYEFTKYIEKIDYYSTTLAINIACELEKKNNVIQITCNKYWYAPHPFTEYLEGKNIRTLGELKEKVNNYEGKTLSGCSIQYWKEMISRIKEFDDIDDYDVSLLTFSEINRILKLGFSERQVKQYSQGIYYLRTGKSNSEDILMKLNYRTMLPEFVSHDSHVIYKRDFDKRYQPYSKTVNDYEIGVVGPDIMKYSNHRYIEDMPVTSKIDKYCKFNKFITEKYSDILSNCSKKYFKSKNDYGFDKKCNSCLGFCVEYFAKIKLFGEDAFKPFIDMACSEAKTQEVTDVIRVRAAMIIYREEMKRCYGPALAGIIPSISITNLIKENYSAFVNKVVELGNIAAKFVLDNVYGGEISKETKFFDPDLSVNHISALCDFISEDTILDLKCTSAINEKHIKQVLSYYYLSTKRTDLHVKKLIVFDVPTQKFIQIDM